MKNILKYSILGLALVLTASPLAHARDRSGDGGGWSRDPGVPPPSNNVAPEVDPSLAIGGFTLLAGSLTVMRSRRRK